MAQQNWSSGYSDFVYSGGGHPGVAGASGQPGPPKFVTGRPPAAQQYAPKTSAAVAQQYAPTAAVPAAAVIDLTRKDSSGVGGDSMEIDTDLFSPAVVSVEELVDVGDPFLNEFLRAEVDDFREPSELEKRQRGILYKTQIGLASDQLEASIYENFRSANSAWIPRPALTQTLYNKSKVKSRYMNELYAVNNPSKYDENLAKLCALEDEARLSCDVIFVTSKGQFLYAMSSVLMARGRAPRIRDALIHHRDLLQQNAHLGMTLPKDLHHYTVFKLDKRVSKGLPQVLTALHGGKLAVNNTSFEAIALCANYLQSDVVTKMLPAVSIGVKANYINEKDESVNDFTRFKNVRITDSAADIRAKEAMTTNHPWRLWRYSQSIISEKLQRAQADNFEPIDFPSDHEKAGVGGFPWVALAFLKRQVETDIALGKGKAFVPSKPTNVEKTWSQSKPTATWRDAVPAKMNGFSDAPTAPAWAQQTPVLPPPQVAPPVVAPPKPDKPSTSWKDIKCGVMPAYNAAGKVAKIPLPGVTVVPVSVASPTTIQFAPKHHPLAPKAVDANAPYYGDPVPVKKLALSAENARLCAGLDDSRNVGGVKPLTVAHPPNAPVYANSTSNARPTHPPRRSPPRRLSPQFRRLSPPRRAASPLRRKLSPPRRLGSPPPRRLGSPPPRRLGSPPPRRTPPRMRSPGGPRRPPPRRLSPGRRSPPRRLSSPPMRRRTPPGLKRPHSPPRRRGISPLGRRSPPRGPPPRGPPPRGPPPRRPSPFRTGSPPLARRPLSPPRRHSPPLQRRPPPARSPPLQRRPSLGPPQDGPRGAPPRGPPPLGPTRRDLPRLPPPRRSPERSRSSSFRTGAEKHIREFDLEKQGEQMLKAIEQQKGIPASLPPPNLPPSTIPASSVHIMESSSQESSNGKWESLDN